MTSSFLGEATFLNDIPTGANEVHGAFVLSELANADIDEIDKTKALSLPGVLGWVDFNDIPGQNNSALIGRYQEEIFCSEKVQFCVTMCYKN